MLRLLCFPVDQIPNGSWMFSFNWFIRDIFRPGLVGPSDSEHRHMAIITGIANRRLFIACGSNHSIFSLSLSFYFTKSTSVWAKMGLLSDFVKQYMGSAQRKLYLLNTFAILWEENLSDWGARTKIIRSFSVIQILASLNLSCCGTHAGRRIYNTTVLSSDLPFEGFFESDCFGEARRRFPLGFPWVLFRHIKLQVRGHGFISRLKF